MGMGDWQQCGECGRVTRHVPCWGLAVEQLPTMVKRGASDSLRLLYQGEICSVLGFVRGH